MYGVASTTHDKVCIIGRGLEELLESLRAEEIELCELEDKLEQGIKKLEEVRGVLNLALTVDAKVAAAFNSLRFWRHV